MRGALPLAGTGDEVMETDGHGLIDRRTFLAAAPRYVLSGMSALRTGSALHAPSGSDGHRGLARRRIAMVDVSCCLAWGAGSCQLCYLRCPLRDEAMALEDGRPTVVVSACDGCGICVDVCRSVNDLGAISLVEPSTV